MRVLLLALSLVAACSIPSAAIAKRVRVDVVKRAFHNTVVLEDNGRTFCSGVIHRKRILTAAHCVSGKETVGVAHAGLNFPARVAYVDDVQDIAVLEAPHRLGRGVPLARRAPRFAEDVWVIGHSHGFLEFSIPRGVVSHPRRHLPEQDEQVWMQHDAGAAGGNSGGPVLNKHGRLVGITSFGILDSVRCVFGCPGAFTVSYIQGAVHWEILNDL